MNNDLEIMRSGEKIKRRPVRVVGKTKRPYGKSQMSGLLSGVACTLLLSVVGSVSHGADPYGVSPPSGKQWTMTFESVHEIAGLLHQGGHGRPRALRLYREPLDE
jgi:hypothetical protein